jgi:SAM-dependent methyltransferase
MNPVKPLRRLSNRILRERLSLLEGAVANFGAGSDSDQEGSSYQAYCAAASSYHKFDAQPRDCSCVQADLTHMPQVLDASFDNGLCVWVLEHAEDPGLAIAEMRRVLKPGARLVLGLPLDYPFHTRHDHWRFGPDGIRKLAVVWDAGHTWPVGRDRRVVLPRRIRFWGEPTSRGPVGWVVELWRA